MAKKNGQAQAVGKVGTYKVSATVNGQTVADVAVAVTAETITAIRKAVPACILPPFVNKKGQQITPKGAHTTFAVKVNGQNVRFGNVLLAIAGQTGMLPQAVNGDNPEGLKGDKRKIVMRLITAALEAAGVIAIRPSGFGAMIYLPENAPASATGGNEMSGSDALASILAS